MEDRLLRAFVAVADHGTFGAAAGALSLTQPALTKQIQALESRVGGPVFERGRHGARLTALGRALLPDARDVVDRLDALALRAARLTAGGPRRLNLGFGLSSIDIAPRAVAAFRRLRPDVAVTLDDMASSVQIERLRRGQLDAGFVRLPAAPELELLELGSDRLALAVPPGTDPTPGPDALIERHGLVRLARAKGPGLARQVDTYLAAAGRRPNTVQYAHDLQTVLALVAAGIAPALVPASAHAIAPDRISLLPIDHPAARWHIGVVWSQPVPAPPLAAFLDLLRDRA
jgi:DNA-binding transcriptional LysR family regulator